MKEFNENYQKRKPVQIQIKISAKLTREHGKTDNHFWESMECLQENTCTLARTGKSIFNDQGK